MSETGKVSRHGAVAMVAATAAVMLSDRLNAQGIVTTGSSAFLGPNDLIFDLGSFKSFQIKLHGKDVVTITPEEMADALRIPR